MRKTVLRGLLVLVLTVGAGVLAATPGHTQNQCLTVGHTQSGPYFEVVDLEGCPKVAYQARWNDYYGNVNYSAIYTTIPALSGKIYRTASVGGTYSNLKGRGCSVLNAGSVCTLGAWYSSAPWINFQ